MMPEDFSMTQIERAFVTIREGQVHLRRSTPAAAARATRPLWMLHASPASSITLLPLMRALAQTRDVIAPDTLGNGDSAPALPDVPDIAYYADSSLRVMDALGIDRADLYGSHTGAHIVAEMAIARPDRFGRVVLDGIGMFSPELKQRLLAHYAPSVQPDFFGSQIHWAWHFVRDQAWYFPYFARDVEHLRAVAPPTAEALHRTTVEVLKAVGTYHHAYRAAFAHPDRERLPLIQHETLAMADEEDPLQAGVPEAGRCLRRGTALVFRRPVAAGVVDEATIDAGTGAKARVIANYLDHGTVTS
jgi:pimeloyl-ACP methyl ester carboxylesterase